MIGAFPLMTLHLPSGGHGDLCFHVCFLSVREALSPAPTPSLRGDFILMLWNPAQASTLLWRLSWLSPEFVVLPNVWVRDVLFSYSFYLYNIFFKKWQKKIRAISTDGAYPKRGRILSECFLLLPNPFDLHLQFQHVTLFFCWLLHVCDSHTGQFFMWVPIDLCCGLNSSPWKRYMEVLTPVSVRVTWFGNRAFVDVMSWDEDLRDSGRP